MRRANRFLAFLGILMALFVLTIVHASLGRGSDGPEGREKRDFVRALGLTDLCLATEANYTRHVSQTDFSTPFQDHPGGLEHFPSGTWIRPDYPPQPDNAQHVDRTAKKHP